MKILISKIIQILLSKIIMKKVLKRNFASSISDKFIIKILSKNDY